jgi:hypothetical protein
MGCSRRAGGTQALPDIGQVRTCDASWPPPMSTWSSSGEMVADCTNLPVL